MAKAKVRFHKGLTTVLRAAARTNGMALDEEQAQLVMAGSELVSEPLLRDMLAQGRNAVLNRSPTIQQDWELAHPTRNPYPPMFAERVRDLVRKMMSQLSVEPDTDLSEDLGVLYQMCLQEMED